MCLCFVILGIDYPQRNPTVNNKLVFVRIGTQYIEGCAYALLSCMGIDYPQRNPRVGSIFLADDDSSGLPTLFSPYYGLSMA